MRILVVEDEALIAMFVCHVLIDAGHEVIGPGKTVDEGFALAQQVRPNLALLNIDLGGERKGTDLARILFGAFRTPVLFLSGNNDAAWGAKDAALGYIAKPCDPSTLVKSIELVEGLARGALPNAQLIPPGLTLFPFSPTSPLS